MNKVQFRWLHHLWKAWLCTLLCLFFLCGIDSTMALAAEVSNFADQGPGLTETPQYVFVNPIYSDVFDESDLVFEEELEAAEVSDTFSSLADLGVALREKMVQRETSWEFVYTDLEGRISDSGALDNSVVQERCRALISDLIGLAMEHTGNPKEGDSLRFQVKGWGYSYGWQYTDSHYQLNLDLSITYMTDAAQEAAVDAAVTEVLSGLALDGKNRYEKLRAVYDYICDTVVYDYENLNDDSYSLKYTAYAAIMNHTAVCQGYSVLLYRLLLECGIDARVVSGIGYDNNGSGGRHAWNLVRMNGMYYDADVTWDAAYKQAGVDYAYFLRCEANFTDHVRHDGTGGDYDYTSQEFMTSYPMAEEDYVYSGEADPEEDPGDTPGDGLEDFVVTDGVLTAYTGTASELVIPATLGITAIGERAFYQNETLVSVSIPDGVTSLGVYAFGKCKNLVSVDLPDSLLSYGSSAFRECWSLKQLSLPYGVTRLPDNLLTGCHSLESFEIPGSVTQLGEWVFSSCRTLEEITIPSSIRSIGAWDFHGCYGLVTVNVHSRLVSIGREAFGSCKSLKTFFIPASVTAIGEYTIDSYKLRDVSGVFDGCISLEEFVVEGANTKFAAHEGVLYNKELTEEYCCPGGKTGSYEVPNGVTRINSFYNGSLSELTIPASVTDIGSVSSRDELVIYCYENTAAESYAKKKGIPYVILVEEGLPIDEEHFPDEAFRGYVSHNFDGDGNGLLSEAEIAGADYISFSSESVASLKGIEYLTSLTYLYCFNTGLAELDLSANTALVSVNCMNNNLTELLLPVNGALETLECGTNALTSLDVDSCPNLRYLSCENNQLTRLDVRQNEELINLSCDDNEIGILQVNNNPHLNALICSNNNIEFLEVSNDVELGILMCDQNRISSLSLKNNPALIHLNCKGNQLSFLYVDRNPNLELLDCSVNQLTSLYVGQNTNLRELYCFNNMISSLDVTSNPNLWYLEVSENSIQEIDISNCPELLDVYLHGETYEYGFYRLEEKALHVDADVLIKHGELQQGIPIDEIHFPDEVFRNYVSGEYDRSGDGALSEEEIANARSVNISNMSIASLRGIEYLTELSDLICNYTNITELNLTANNALFMVDCSFCSLNTLVLPQNSPLSHLMCSCNNLTSLDVTNCFMLEDLYCDKNQLVELDVSRNGYLQSLVCAVNQIEYLELNSNTELRELNLSYNPISSIDIFNLSNLSWLDAFETSVAVVDITQCPNLVTVFKQENLVESGYYQLGDFGLLRVNPEVQILVPGLSIDETHFADAVFRDYVSANFDQNSDGMLSEEEIAKATSISFSSARVESLKGIEYLTGLTKLFCFNTGLTELDLRVNTALESVTCIQNHLQELLLPESGPLHTVECSMNELTSLDVSACPNLKYLYCNQNQLTELDVTQNENLVNLLCYGNQLTSLRANNNPNLRAIACAGNYLTSLDVYNDGALEVVSCDENALSVLDVYQNPLLTELHCANNQLTELDITNNSELTALYCSGNQLRNLDVSQNPKLAELNCSENMLSSLSVVGNPELGILDVFGNPLTELDISGCPSLLAAYRASEEAGEYYQLDDWELHVNSDVLIKIMDASLLMDPDFVLPLSLKSISEKAFQGAAFCYAYLPDGVESIGNGAFASCSHLLYIRIPASVTFIGEDVFDTDVVIVSVKGSYAEDYAKSNGFMFMTE